MRGWRRSGWRGCEAVHGVGVLALVVGRRLSVSLALTLNQEAREKFLG